MSDPRSAAAAEYRRLYKTARWTQFRVAYLAQHPLCARCLIQEIVTEATVVHHAEAHRGDVVKFWTGPFEGLCKPHHDREGRLEDSGKTVMRFDADGWPV